MVWPCNTAMSSRGEVNFKVGLEKMNGIHRCAHMKISQINDLHEISSIKGLDRLRDLSGIRLALWVLGVMSLSIGFSDLFSSKFQIYFGARR